MKRALVLGGGGARGAFQFGALKYIKEVLMQREEGYDMDIIAGVSVGALNASMWAMGEFEGLQDLWEDEALEGRIFEGGMEVFSLMKHIVYSGKSLRSNMPLFSLLKQYMNILSPNLIGKDLTIGLVSLRDGNYYQLGPKDFDESEEFAKAVLASASIPIIAEPVPMIRTIRKDIGEGGVLYDLVDGGIRNNSPLGDVIHQGADEIIIINCASPKIPMEETLDAAKNIFSIAKRSLINIAINEIFITDVREYLAINDILAQVEKYAPGLEIYHTRPNGERVPYKRFKTILIEPEDSLGDVLDFTPNKVRLNILKGYKAAEEAFALAGIA